MTSGCAHRAAPLCSALGGWGVQPCSTALPASHPLVCCLQGVSAQSSHVRGQRLPSPLPGWLPEADRLLLLLPRALRSRVLLLLIPPPPTGSVARRARSRAALTQASVPPLCFPADTAPSLCATPTVIAAASRNLLSVKTRRGKVFTKQRHYFHPHCSTV